MKAIVCHAFAPITDLRLEEIDPPQPGPGEVAIAVAAAGINFLDGLMVQGKYQTKPPFPFTPGSEVSGTVAALGAGVTGFAVGDPVAAFCRLGGYAETVTAPADHVFAIGGGIDPPTAAGGIDPVAAAGGIDPVAAAGFLITYGTSYFALKDRARLRAGETLLVLGAGGGVGLAAVELGKALGARVIAAASSAEKLALAQAHGADDLIDYADGTLREQVRALVGSKGIDVVYDPVGGALAEAAYRTLGWQGRHLVVGFASGPMPAFPPNLLLLKNADLLGVYWGDAVQADPDHHAANMADLFGYLRDGRVKPYVSETFALADAVEALGRVMDRQATGKVVLTVPGRG
jgi:NADPH2:quinone reductase